MCEGFVSTAKQISAYLNTSTEDLWLLRQMGSNGGINSIEVAVLCLMQKIMNEQDARSSKMTIEIHARAKYIHVFAPELVLYYTVLTITSSSHPAILSQKPLPKITKY